MGLANITPDSPPSKNVAKKPTENSIGVSKVNCPFHMVPIQLKNLIPVGIADQIRHETEERQQDGAGGEHVVRPHRDRQRRDRPRVA